MSDGTTYTSEQVASIAGVPYRTLMRWIEESLIEIPLTRYARRNRVPVRWNAKNVREIVILAKLRAYGFSLQRIRGILKYLRSIGENPFSTGKFLLIFDGQGKPGELVKVCTTGETIALMKQNRGQLVLPLWSPET